MKRASCPSAGVALLATLALGILSCAGHPPLEPRVTGAQAEEAKRLTAPFGNARRAPADIVAAGKVLYEGKGACFYCHGLRGRADEPGARMFTPNPPRDFSDCNWHNERTDGEIFWIIKNGSLGTGMQALIPGMLNEDEAWRIVAYVRAFCKTQM